MDIEALKFQAFKENSDRAYIYILKVNDDNESYSNTMPEEYFFDFETACECGHETGQPFKVEKYLVTVSGADSSYVSMLHGLNLIRRAKLYIFAEGFLMKMEKQTKPLMISLKCRTRLKKGIL